MKLRRPPSFSLRRLLGAGFLFFLIKGLLWLLLAVGFTALIK